MLRRPLAPPQAPHSLIAVAARHIAIHEHHIETAARTSPQGLRRALRQGDAAAKRFKNDLGAQAMRRVIVDHQHGEWGPGRAVIGREICDGEVGRRRPIKARIDNTAPLYRSAHKRPPVQN
ncbi:MAG: hypothetical protein JWM33_2746 [Caulobacteraceae bacterium]|nr:hypothetical protein [Caulobacteraceae bacterium]